MRTVERLRLGMVLAAAGLLLASCGPGVDGDGSSQVPAGSNTVADVNSATIEAVSAVNSECLALFRQEFNAYGYEDCLLGDFAQPVSYATARRILSHVWRAYGAGPQPSLEIDAYACSGGACAVLEGDGTRKIVFPNENYVEISALLHEVTHHLTGVGSSQLAGGHGNDFRCAVVEVYAVYLPHLVTAASLTALRQVCGLTAEEASVPVCTFDVAGWAEAQDAVNAASSVSVDTADLLQQLEQNAERIAEIDILIVKLPKPPEVTSEYRREQVAEMRGEQYTLEREQRSLLKQTENSEAPSDEISELVPTADYRSC